jgi:hypothetical protein
MSQDVLNDWIASLLSIFGNRESAKLVHVGQDRVRAVQTAPADHMRILHQIDRPTKFTSQVKQAVIELTLQHPNFADLQITQIISERFAIPIARATIHRLHHLAHFKFLPPKRCQRLTEIQRRQRDQFASDFINGKFQTKNLIFSDESRFCMGRIIGRCGERGGDMRKGFWPRLMNISGSRFIYGRRSGLVSDPAFQFLKKQSIQMSTLRL